MTIDLRKLIVTVTVILVLISIMAFISAHPDVYIIETFREDFDPAIDNVPNDFDPNARNTVLVFQNPWLFEDAI